jgi:GntR family transcriptional repressor for pyruvate dehydrogenase complex
VSAAPTQGEGARAERAPALANGGAGAARASSSRVNVRPVRKAYEQVADQLRELIMAGELEQGERLPNEALLASEFGVSRATIREALRALAAQNLIRTVKGGGGGSYVTVPSVDHISDFVHANLNLLSDSRSVSLDELLEARELLEVPAARLAAIRKRDGDLDALRSAIPEEPEGLDTTTQFTHNADFHTAVIRMCDNALLGIAAQPIFTLLQTSLARSSLGRSFHRAINAHHRAIVEAIEAGDPDGAEREMRDHLVYLRPYYERTWRSAERAVARP